MRLAIVVIGHVGAGEVEVVRRKLVDRQVALILGDVVVGGRGALIQLIGEGVLARTSVGLKARGLGSEALLTDEAFLLVGVVGGCGDLVVGQRGAVIILRGAARSQLHGTLGDSEAHVGSTGVDLERHVGEVRIGALEVIGVERLGVGDNGTSRGVDSDVRTGDSQINAVVKRNVCSGELTVTTRDAGNLVTGNRVLLAVVDDGLALGLDCHDDCIGVGGNSELTGGRRDLVVVLVGALVESVGKGVIDGTNVGDGAGHVVRGTLALDEALALLDVELRDGDAIVGKRRAVILLGVGGGGHGDLALVHRDGLRAGEVLIGLVVVAPGAQLNRDLARMRKRDLGRVRHPGLTVGAVLDGQAVAVLVLSGGGISRQLGTVVELAYVVLSPLGIVVVDAGRLDLEPAVSDLELNVGEVGAVVREIALLEAHIVRVDDGAGSNSIAVERDATLGIEVIAGLKLVALNGLLCTVERLGLGITGNGDRHLIGNRRDLERTGLGLNLVVVSVGAAIQLIAEGVLNLALAHVGDRLAIGEACALALSKTGDGFHLFLVVRLAVIDPGVRSGLEGNLGLLDNELAVLGLNRELLGNIVALGVGHLGRTGDVVGVGASISLLGILGRKTGDGVLLAVLGELVGLDTLGLVGLAVVRGGGGIGLDRNLVLGTTVGDVQRAVTGLDVVVVFRGALVQRVAEGILRVTRDSLTTRDGVGCALAVSEAVASDLHVGLLVAHQRRAVVLLLSRGRGQHNIALGDSKLTVSHVELDVGEVLAVVSERALGETHLIGIGIGRLYLRGALVGEVILLVQVVVYGDIVACGGLLGAVVLGLGLVTRDGHNNLAGHRNDAQLTDLLGDDVVAVLALSGATGQRVLKLVVDFALTHIGDAAGRLGLEALTLRKAAACDGDGLSGERRAVIDLGCSLGLQRDLALGDSQRSVDDLKLNVGEVRAVVDEVARFELHLISAGVGAAHGSGAAEGEVVRGVEVVAAGNIVARGGLLGTVIGVAAAVLSDGHGNLVGNRGDLELTVLGLHVVVLGIQTRNREGVIRLTNIGDRTGVVVRDLVLIGIRNAAARDISIVLSQRLAVVDPLGRLGLDGDVALVDLQRTVLGGNGKLARYVVALGIFHHGSTGHGVRVGIRIGALGAGSREALDGVGVAINREGRGLDTVDGLLGTVVRLGGGVALNRDLVLGLTVGNGQRAVLGRDGVVISLGIVLQRVAEGVITGAGLGLRARHLIGSTLALNKALAGLGVELGGRDLRVLERLAVVLLLITRGSKLHGSRINGELAVLGGHLELLGNILAVKGDLNVGDLIVDRRDISGLRVGRVRSDDEGHALVIGIGAGSGGNTRSRVLIAIVFHGRRVAFNRDRILGLAIVNGQLALGLRDDVVIGVGAVLQRIGEGVVGLAHVSLATGKAVGCAFVLDPAGLGLEGGVAVGERAAVVILGQIGGLKRDGALGNVNGGLSGKRGGLSANGHVLAHVNGVGAGIREARLVRAPGLAAVGRILNVASRDELFGLRNVLRIQTGTLVDIDVYRNGMRLAVVRYVLARSREARPQGIEGVRLIVTIYISNLVAGLANRGSLVVALLVHPADEGTVRSRGLTISHREGVVLRETVVVVPLLGTRSLSGLVRRGPRSAIQHQVIAGLTSLLLVNDADNVLRLVLADGQLIRSRLAVGIALDLGMLDSILLNDVADLVAGDSLGIGKLLAGLVYIFNGVLAVLSKSPGARERDAVFGHRLAIGIPTTERPVTTIVRILINGSRL